MGAEVEARDGRLPPLTVKGAALQGIDYRLPVASAQVKSCVLIAGLLADDRTSVTEGSRSRDHTERLLRRARVPFERDGLRCTVSQVDELELEQIAVPGDPSSAAFMVAAAILVPDSCIVVSDVALNWTRAGFIRIAQRMGAVVLGDLEEPGTTADEEPVGELDVCSGPLEGTEVQQEEVPLAIDELTLIALLGAFADGETVVRGAADLRHKETDRIAGVVDGLAALGADIEELDDGFAVRGDGSPLEGGTLQADGDHRMAMLGAVAGMASRNGVEVVELEMGDQVVANGEDVTEAIRAPEVSEAASKVATNPGVRAALVEKQREVLSSGDWVVEGRDIGTVVAPDAEVKVFL